MNSRYDRKYCTDAFSHTDFMRKHHKQTQTYRDYYVTSIKVSQQLFGTTFYIFRDTQLLYTVLRITRIRNIKIIFH